MGTPKHLIWEDGQTWLERTVDRLTPLVDQVVLSGRGQVPDNLGDLPRLADVPGVAGPMTGLLAAMRWQPDADWLLLGCDQPAFSEEAISWLRDQTGPGIHAVLPDLAGDGRPEPLLAWYDSRIHPALEDLAGKGCLRLGGLAGRHGVISPTPPDHLRSCWRNINTPEELARLRDQS
jgi:molybdopterin-guanine dinucleotide biosynthesis protein A